MQPDLRPLGIGEILDRAVTLFVRRFAVLVLILALVAIPIAILQYASQPETSAMITDLGRILTAPAGHPEAQREILRQLAAKNQVSGLALALILGGAVLSTLSNTACIIAVAQSYSGRLPSVREVYREALRRWPAQLAAGVIFLGLGVVLFFVWTLVAVLVALGIAATGKAALIVGIPLAIIAIVVFFGLTVLLYFTAQMSLVSIALEEANPIRGIAHGLRRTLSPAVFWRSALVGTIVFVVSFIGTLVLFSVAAAVSALTHLTALNPVVAVIGGVALNALLTTFIVIYAIDVRVRREGYDLVLASQETAP